MPGFQTGFKTCSNPQLWQSDELAVNIMFSCCAQFSKGLILNSLVYCNSTSNNGYLARSILKFCSTYQSAKVSTGRTSYNKAGKQQSRNRRAGGETQRYRDGISPSPPPTLPAWHDRTVFHVDRGFFQESALWSVCQPSLWSMWPNLD